MGFGNIKIDRADQMFSLYIRTRDKRCVSCKRPGIMNQDGLPVLGLQCSHFWSRRNESTRFEPDNCDALCARCHQRWGGDYRDEYKAFKLKQLGQIGYRALEVQHHQYCKKDREMALIKARALLGTVTLKKNPKHAKPTDRD